MDLIARKTIALRGEVTMPSSKSQSIRALLLVLLSEGESVLQNILHSEDTRDAINICKNLGATVSESGSTLTINSKGLPIEELSSKIHSGNSGITTRFIMPLLGLRRNSKKGIILNCHDQMRARPIKSLVTALEDLGMQIAYLEKEGTLPVSISGELRGGKTTVAGITSQYLSALLLALPCAKTDSEITVQDLHERPYVEMTLNCLKEQGMSFEQEIMPGVDVFKIKGQQSYKKFSTSISADFSSASYFIAAASLIPGEVILRGLNRADTQGDKRLVSLLQTMGADIVMEPDQLRIRGGNPLRGIKIDANDIPDLVPTLAVVGTYATGKTEIVNVAQARIKETDRIHSMTEGLRKMGAQIEEFPDGLTIYQSTLHGAQVKGYEDHRTVMALALAGIMAEGETIIDEGEAIHKTFPTFVELMRSLAANMEFENGSSD